MIKRVEKGLKSGEKVESKEDMLSERVIKGPKGVTYEKCNWKIKKKIKRQLRGQRRYQKGLKLKKSEKYTGEINNIERRIKGTKKS